MKAIMVMFDSLNRQMLPPYAPQTWVHAPNFERLARRTVCFDRSYVCSMPCMPARRELHTGRPNFLHRSWGPLEPFDDSMPELLSAAGIYTHLATDHYHYFEDGGATYHSRYDSWQLFRGQEGDTWMGQVADPPPRDTVFARRGKLARCYEVNRQFMQREQDQPQPQTFAAGLDFIRRNHAQDRWFLQLETFDPHEPFFSHRKYKDLYAQHYDAYRGRDFDWPNYGPVRETAEEVEHARHEYAALLSMCDAHLGDVLNLMDELDLWKDTMLIVCTDHGFMLGEHECWAKCWQPFYEEISHTPLFIWDPRCAQAGQVRQSLVQNIDWAPTLLEYFGVERPADMLGRALCDTIARDQPVRAAGLFGIFGGQVNVTDGRYIYMRAAAGPDNQPLYEYTLMPTHMRSRFGVEELRGKIELAPALPFTKGCDTVRIRCDRWPAPGHPDLLRTLLFDLQTDPAQQHPLHDAAVEQRMIGHLVALMKDCAAPPEQFERLGLRA
jgi:arylsulfatase A-like enzyme